MAQRRPPRREGHAATRHRRPGGPARTTPRKSSPAPPRPRGESGESERLQKVLAHAGIGSRRACEDVILQGRVTVDGQVVRELGTRVDPHRAKIAVDGEPIRLERMVYYAVNKPKGYVSTTHDPSGRPRVVDLLPEIPQRVYTVGRLDEMSTGLMLLTNDGELAHRLAHPKFGVEKLYRAVVAGSPDREVLAKLTEGIWLAEGKVRAKRVRVVGRKGEATVLEMVLAEGKNREVRRMLAKLGHKVMTLTRVAVGPITLKGLAPGEYRPLSSHEVELLHKGATGIVVTPVKFSEPKPSRGPAGQARPRRQGGPAAKPARHPTGASEAQGRPHDQGRGPGDAPPPRRPAGPGGPRRASAPPVGPGPERAGGPTSRADARPIRIRPEGLPPAPRRPSPPPPRPPAPPRVEAPTRRIIGLDLGPEAAGPPPPRPRRPGLQPRPRRASLGRRRPRPRREGEPEE